MNQSPDKRGADADRETWARYWTYWYERHTKEAAEAKKFAEEYGAVFTLSHVAPSAERVRLILKGYADSYRQMDRDPANDGNVMAGSVYADFTNNIIPQVLEAIACVPSATPRTELPLKCEAVGGMLDMRIGENVLAFATENCPGLWDAEKDRGRYRITDAAVFAKAVAHELNDEGEDGSTPLSRVLDAAVEEAINQGAEGVEENNSPDGGNDHGT